jgi:hypothetical protein
MVCSSVNRTDLKNNEEGPSNEQTVIDVQL